MRLVGVEKQLLVRKLESICPRISLLFSILNPAPNLLSLFESPSRMTCNRRLDITAESHAKFQKRRILIFFWINKRNQCRNAYSEKKFKLFAPDVKKKRERERERERHLKQLRKRLQFNIF